MGIFLLSKCGHCMTVCSRLPIAWGQTIWLSVEPLSTLALLTSLAIVSHILMRFGCISEFLRHAKYFVCSSVLKYNHFREWSAVEIANGRHLWAVPFPKQFWTTLPYSIGGSTFGHVNHLF